MNRDRLDRPTRVRAGLLARTVLGVRIVRRSGTVAFATVCALATGLVGNTAYALNCTKPTTRAEAAICASPTLQRLDRELDALYHKALKESASPNTLKRQQQEWLHALNLETSGGAGPAILEGAYRGRMAILHCDLMGKAVLRPVVLKKLPADPNVWSFLPATKGPQLFGGVLLPDGDVGLDLYDQRTGQEEFKRFFFARSLSKVDQCRIKLNAAMDGFRFGHATLSDGRTIIALPGGSWTPRTHCYLGPVSDAVDIYPEGRHSASQEIEKTFLYVLDKPEHVVNGSICEANPSESFTLRVMSLPITRFMPLSNGAFLVMSANGRAAGLPDFVMRFNSHFQTKSQILKGRLFIVDTAKLNRWLASDHWTNYGGMQQDLLRWLTDNKQARNR